MTYLEMVNDVLVRLREAEVQTVSQSAYSKLVGKFINDGKRQVEDAFDWNALKYTYNLNTSPSISSYVLSNSGIRFRVSDVINDTKDIRMELATTQYMNELFLTSSQSGVPEYYNFNGINSNGDTIVDLFPIPDGVYNIKFSVFQPTAPLVNNTDVTLIPNEPILFYAYARALAERGEDGGLGSSEAYQLFQQSLADHVAMEFSKTAVDYIWTN
jgi:hypothetical protein